MTGRYQQQFGYDNNIEPAPEFGLPLTEIFGAKRLQSLGYQTGLVGKWHLENSGAFLPNERGFNWFYGFYRGASGYYPADNPRASEVILENKIPTKEEGYVTDRFGDAACKFISQNKAKSFFLLVSFTAPHSPNEPKPEDAKRTAHIDDEQTTNYAGLVVALDDNVGKILKHLEKEGLKENTLVIFTNDNGGQTRTGADNTPLQGKKGDLREGGIRVPWAMCWSGEIKPGSVINDPIISLDILPTMVEISGNKIDPDWKLNGDRLTDVYSLGAIMYYLLTAIPFEVDMPLASELSTCDERYDEVIAKAMHQDRIQRYENVNEFLADLTMLRQEKKIAQRMPAAAAYVAALEASKNQTVRVVQRPEYASELDVEKPVNAVKKLYFPKAVAS